MPPKDEKKRKRAKSVDQEQQSTEGSIHNDKAEMPRKREKGSGDVSDRSSEGIPETMASVAPVLIKPKARRGRKPAALKLLEAEEAARVAAATQGDDTAAPEEMTEQQSATPSTVVAEEEDIIKVETNEEDSPILIERAPSTEEEQIDVVVDTDDKPDAVEEADVVKEEKPRKSRKGNQIRRLQMEAGIVVDEDDKFEGRIHTSRAAALVAKTKLKVKSGSLPPPVASPPPTKPAKEPKEPKELKEPKEPKESKAAHSAAPMVEEADEEADKKAQAQWVMCDKCSKWRKLPADVAIESLPEVWDCSMITWYSYAIVCEGENAEEPEAEKETKAKKPKLLRKPSRASSTDVAEPDDTEVPVVIKKKPRAASVASNVPELVPAKAVENINWVECHACNKWRKLPSHVNPADLPDVWTCSQNYWSPAYARCSAKEEEDDKQVFAATETAVHTSGPGRRGRPVAAPEVPIGTKKVTQWVQCERKNCGKWRKVASHIDPSTFSDPWYCEHNHWNPDRQSCDALE